MSSTAPHERTSLDRCPGVIALHAAADGWLARVRLPGGRLSAAQLHALAATADDLGSGLIDLTARANVQLRGLGHDCATALARRLAHAGLLPSHAHDRVRNVLASPLAGRAPQALDDIDDVVALLDRRVCAAPTLAELPGRFCFLVDDSAGAHVRADVGVAALGGGRFEVLLDERPLAFEGDAGEAVTLAIRAAEAFLDVCGDAWRIAEVRGGARAVADRLGVALATRQPPARARAAAATSRAGATTCAAAVTAPGRQEQRDGRVAVTALAPLGQLWPELLRELARLAPEVRLSTRRTVTILDVDAGSAGAVLAALQRAGLVVDCASGWVGLTACAGAGACGRALADVRAAAAQRALVRPPGAGAEHWAACERRCGEGRDTVVAIAAQRADHVMVRCGTRAWREPSLDAARRTLETGAGR